MSTRGVLLVVTGFALGLPAVGAAQGLGDVAARARADREKQASEGESTESRSFSNDDLEGLSDKTNEDSEGTVSTLGSGASSTTGRPAGPTRTPEQMRQAQVKPLEDTVARNQARVNALEASVEELQQRLNPMSTTYVYGGTGGPVGGTQSSEEMRVRSQLAAAEQQLAQARQALSASESALDEARRGRLAPVGPRDQPLPPSEDPVRQRN